MFIRGHHHYTVLPERALRAGRERKCAITGDLKLEEMRKLEAHSS